MKTKKILIAISTICMFGLLLIAVMKSSLLSIQVIDIAMEASSADKTAVEELSGLKVGQSIFSINKSTVEQNINQSGTYHVTSIQIKYPNEVTINVEKRTICAAVEYNNQYILIDKNCNVMSTADTVDEYTIILTGISVSQFRSGEPLITKEPQQKNALIETLTSIESNGIAKHFSRIAFDDLTNIYFITPNGVKVNLCEAVDLSEKLAWLTTTELTNAIYTAPFPQNITLYKDKFAIQK